MMDEISTVEFVIKLGTALLLGLLIRRPPASAQAARHEDEYGYCSGQLSDYDCID